MSDKVGDIIVFAGTNEVGIITKDSGKGYFSQRMHDGTLGEVQLIGKLTPSQADIYWQRQKEKRVEKNGTGSATKKSCPDEF